MNTYTISAKERNGCHVIPLRREKETKEGAVLAAWRFSQTTTLCDVALTQGSKHVAAYRDGVITHLNGKEHKA